MGSKKPLSIFLFIEAAYFAGAVFMALVQVNLDVQELDQERLTAASPDVLAGFASNLQQPFLLLMVVVFFRFLIQRRWFELASPALFIATVIWTIVAYFAGVSGDSCALGTMIASLAQVGLNGFFLLRTTQKAIASRRQQTLGCGLEHSSEEPDKNTEADRSRGTEKGTPSLATAEDDAPEHATDEIIDTSKIMKEQQK